MTLSPEQIAKSRVAWEAYESTLLSIKGLGKQIGTALIEPLGLAATGVKAFIATFKDDMMGGVKTVADTFSNFIRGAFDLFAKYGIPFINGFISFANQIGEAFETLFDFISPSTEAIGKGLGFLFTELTEFMATFKQHLVLFISAPIEAVIKGAFGLLIKLNKSIQESLVPIAFGLAEIGAVSNSFASGLSDAFDDQQRAMTIMGHDFAQPFADAQIEAASEIGDILAKQAEKNKAQQSKFTGFLSTFGDKFDFAIQKLPVIAVDAAKEMARSISEKSAGLILSGSQEEQNIINSSKNKQLQLQQDTLKEQKRTNQLIAKLDTF